LTLQHPLDAIPEQLAGRPLELSEQGDVLVYTYDCHEEHTGIPDLLRELSSHGIDFKDLNSSQSSLEDIFVSLVREKA
jgi:ABC-2 type transport system ATP-binding protein